MTILRRPWGEAATGALTGSDCALLLAGPEGDRHASPLLRPAGGRGLWALRYPGARSRRDPPSPACMAQVPPRWREGEREPVTDAEREGRNALVRMRNMLARIEELDAALDDPRQVWVALAASWAAAGERAAPRLTEIVRQARPGSMPRHLFALERRLRRVLTRRTAQVPLDRVEEIDLEGMAWLSRRPGANIAERAGPEQRILATVRDESYDTLENRVLRAYCTLAARVARGWLEENARASDRPRYGDVKSLHRRCLRTAADLAARGVGLADPALPPNFVLGQDRDYRAVRRAWIALRKKDNDEDDLWTVQAQTWVDFATLAIVLSLAALPGADLAFQSPLDWTSRHEGGAWLAVDNPLAVFWLRSEGLVIEVQLRPRAIEAAQMTAGAAIWLRIGRLDGTLQHRVAVWPLHSFAPVDTGVEARAAAAALTRIRPGPGQPAMRRGIVLAQAFGNAAAETAEVGSHRVTAVTLDAAGPGLTDGLAGLRMALEGLARE